MIRLIHAPARKVADVTVNAVRPGEMHPARDDPNPGMLRQLDGETGWSAFLSAIPRGRPPPAEDVGHARAYLTSHLAANITGAALTVSGGQQMR